MLDATCPLCFIPFGGLSRAPFALTCGHVFCVNCLRSESTTDCRLCGTDRASHLNSQIQNLWRTASNQTGLPTSDLGDSQPASMEPRELNEAIASVNKSTPLSYISRLYSTCEAFLGEQPRSKCKELATHLSLLGLLLDQKLIVQRQNELVGSLTKEIQQLRDEKGSLQADVEAISASHKQREQGSAIDVNMVGRLLRGDTEYKEENVSRRPSRDEGQAPSLTWPPEPQGSFLMQPVVSMTPEIMAPVARHSMKHFMDPTAFSDLHLRAVSDLQNTDDSLLVPEERRTIEKLQSTGYVPHVSNTSQPSSLDAQGARRASLHSITRADVVESLLTSPTPGDSSFMTDSITLLKTPDNGSKQLSPINMGPFVFGIDSFPHQPLLAAILQPDLVPLPASPPLSTDRFVTLDLLNSEHLRSSSPKHPCGRPLSRGSANAESFTTQSSEDVVEIVQERRRLHLMEVLANICMDEQLSASSSSTSISSPPLPVVPDADTPLNGGSIWGLELSVQENEDYNILTPPADRINPPIPTAIPAWRK